MLKGGGILFPTFTHIHWRLMYAAIFLSHLAPIFGLQSQQTVEKIFTWRGLQINNYKLPNNLLMKMKLSKHIPW
jgi:hypothetical protein